MLTHLRKFSHYFIENQNGIVTDAGDSFCIFTEYPKEEVVGRTSDAVFADLLRAGSDLFLSGDETEAILFTKSLEARCVHIGRSKQNGSAGAIYYIHEIPDSRFEDSYLYLEQLITENVLGVGVYSPDLRLIKANQTYLGYLPNPYKCKETAFGKYIGEITPGFEESSAKENFQKVIDSRQSLYISEKRSLLLGNDNKFWDNVITPVTVNGQLKYLVSILQDVTDRILSRAIVQEQKEHYEALLDHMSDGLISFDKDGDIIHMNKSIEDARKKYDINFSTEKYCGVNGTEIPRDNLPRRRLLDGKEVKKQIIMIKRGGENVYFECDGSTVSDNKGSFKLGILNYRDITQTIEYENKIKNQKEELDALLEHMVECMVTIDPQGRILRMNANAMRVLGLKSIDVHPNVNELINRIDFKDLNGEILSPDHPSLSNNMIKKRFTNLELWLHLKDSDMEPSLFSFAGTPVYNDAGDIVYSIITFKDITEQWKIQEELINAIKEKNDILSEAIAFKDEFLYLITHEMKTPLAVINSALQAMDIVCGQMPAKTTKYLKTIRQNTNRQLRLVNNLLDIVKINSGKIRLNNDRFDIVRLTSLIVQSIQPIAMQEGVRVDFISRHKRKVILIDEEKVERILLNLLSNALKFTPRNKAITVTVYEKTVHKKDMVCISIHDQGIGIPMDKQSVIFERFGQVSTSLSRPAEGAGIGLYLVKLLVDTMGGFILLDSTEGIGSNFTVMFPCTKPDHNCTVRKERPLSSDASHLINELAIQFSDIYF